MVASYRDKLVSPGGPANRKLTVTPGQHLKQTRHRKNTGSGPEGYRKELKNEQLQVRVKCKDSYIIYIYSI